MHNQPGTAFRQRGVVLFFTLIALVVMSLAAVALIRSVDTSTMIAGNLAFRQTATTSGDAGIAAAINWLAAQQQSMINNGQNVYSDPGVTLLFNQSNPANAALGYYSSVLNANLTSMTWDGTNSALVQPDGSGNNIRYIIERMCMIPNAVPTTPNCLFATPVTTLNSQAVASADQVCQGAGCIQNARSPQLRITAQVAGPNNTYSYVQTFAY
jgi:type IV pilus assembly protein PilX